MFKRKKLSKSGFVQGAFISTFGIVISKILGIIYVIPFYSIVKTRGGALYGYAYTIYSLFLALATAGIPLAVSKIISEYQTLGYYKTKLRAFKIARFLSFLIGLIFFIILFIFAPLIAKLILGNLTGGNTIEDVTFVIRVIDTAILVVPLLSVYRGYLEGHKYITPSSSSNVVEQIVRVLVIIFGSLLSVKVFHFKLSTTIGIAVFGATLGAFISLFYLVNITHKKKLQLSRRISNTREPKISNKKIIRKIFIYALPFIMIDVFKVLYDFIDMSTVVKTIAGMNNYTLSSAEAIMSIISTWGAKFSMIISAVSTGIMVSLIPNLTESVIKKDKEDINRKINKTFQILFVSIIPMVVGLSLLSKPIWFLFYGGSKIGPSVFAYYIFTSFFVSTFTILVTILQVLKDYKTVFISLVIGVLLKCFLNVTLMNSFYNMGLPPYYGNITATIIGYFSSLIYCLFALNKKFKINFEVTLKNLVNVIFSTLFMIVSIVLLRFVFPQYSNIRVVNIFIILCYVLIGGITYFAIIYKTGTLNAVFGRNFLSKISLQLKSYFNKKH
ncbi:MAG: polysaccharide biosynthesis protein [Bacilli bacterium]|nr:polysaccharide biosynthesis protein [Bacilli bacterium]